jgi:cation transporter-like permease
MSRASRCIFLTSSPDLARYESITPASPAAAAMVEFASERLYKKGRDLILDKIHALAHLVPPLIPARGDLGSIPGAAEGQLFLPRCCYCRI